MHGIPQILWKYSYFKMVYCFSPFHDGTVFITYLLQEDIYHTPKGIRAFPPCPQILICTAAFQVPKNYFTPSLWVTLIMGLIPLTKACKHEACKPLFGLVGRLVGRSFGRSVSWLVSTTTILT